MSSCVYDNITREASPPLLNILSAFLFHRFHKTILREGFIRKKKKLRKFSTSVLTPPPLKVEKVKNLFFSRDSDLGNSSVSPLVCPSVTNMSKSPYLLSASLYALSMLASYLISLC